MTALPFVDCRSGKVPHWSEAEARAHADRLNAKTTDGLGPAEAYRCRECGQWHTGRKWKTWRMQNVEEEA